MPGQVGKLSLDRRDGQRAADGGTQGVAPEGVQAPQTYWALSVGRSPRGKKPGPAR